MLLSVLLWHHFPSPVQVRLVQWHAVKWKCSIQDWTQDGQVNHWSSHLEHLFLLYCSPFSQPTSNQEEKFRPSLWVNYAHDMAGNSQKWRRWQKIKSWTITPINKGSCLIVSLVTEFKWQSWSATAAFWFLCSKTLALSNYTEKRSEEWLSH